MARTKRKIKINNSTARSRFHRSVSKILCERNQIVRQCMTSDQGDLSVNITTSSTNDIEKNDLFKEVLIDWINDNRISKRAVNQLLSIFNSFGIGELPKDYRTLLKTDINIEIIEISGGKLWYNGIRKCLLPIFRSLDRNLTISLKFNIDGLPLYKSSKQSFYPILASIHGER